jgi:hypothetical protein
VLAKAAAKKYNLLLRNMSENIFLSRRPKKKDNGKFVAATWNSLMRSLDGIAAISR